MRNSNEKPHFYITTPIYYINSEPHIGSGYTTIVCDVMTRYMKANGYDVKFLTGTDEHGQKVQRSAEAKGIESQKFADEISVKFRDLVRLLDCKPSYFEAIQDDFIRTTHPVHKQNVQAIWRKLYENGWIYKDSYAGWYCVSDEAFYDESELIDGKTSLGKEVEWVEEENYFFRLSEFQKALLAIYRHYPEFVQPESKRREVSAFVSGLSYKECDEGQEPLNDYLKDLSVSRKAFDWGIKVPGDENHVIYVWLDALTNYVNALGYPEGDDYKKYWKNDRSVVREAREACSERTQRHVESIRHNIQHDTIMNIVGKDILRFHTVYWPAFLIGLTYTREELKIKVQEKCNFIAELIEGGTLPTHVYSHGWWTNEGQKISKSLGNAIYPQDEIDWLKTLGATDESAVDYLRYFLLKEMPFGNDGDYSRDKLIEKVNADLVNNLGNLAQRSLSMIFKNCDGKIPEPTSYAPVDKELLDYLTNNEFFNYDKHLTILDTKMDFQGMLEKICLFGNRCNTYIEEQAPWALKKTDINRMNTVLYVLAESIRKIAIMLRPTCPKSANAILDQIKISESERDFVNLDNDFMLKSNTEIDKPQGVFPRLVKE